MSNRKFIFSTVLTLLWFVSIVGAIYGLHGMAESAAEMAEEQTETKFQEFACVVQDGTEDMPPTTAQDCHVDLLDRSLSWMAEHMTDVEIGPSTYVLRVEYRDVKD